MFGDYKKVLTEEGKKLHARCLAGEIDSIKFTRFKLGAGIYTGEETIEQIAAMTDLLSSRDEFPVAKAEVVNNATCRLTLIATNLEIEEGYNVTEVGVFAKPYGEEEGEEILYTITVADPEHPDWMPPYNNIAPGSLRYLDYITVGNAESITIASPAGLVPIEDFESLAERVEVLEEKSASMDKRITALEEASAGMVGIKRKCAADGTPQSSTAWTRIGQATGATVEYARGDEEVQNDLMEMWPYNKIRPCNVAMSGSVVAYLGDAGFDWYAKTGSAAGTSVMDEVPTEMYISHFFQEDESGQNWEYKIIADSPRYPNSVYVKELMKRADGTETEYFYFPCFLGSLDSSGHFVSVAGVFPLHSATVTADRTSVKTNGDNWQLIDVWAWEIMTYLLEIMSADANFRTTFGRGFCDSGGTAYAALNTASSTNKITISKDDAEKMRVGMAICIGTAIWNFSTARDRTITAITESTSYGDAVDITFDGAAVAITAGTSKVWRCAQKTGATVSMASPNGTAGANDGIHSVRALYVEDFWGMLHTGVDGMNLKFNSEKMGLEMYVCTDPSKYSDAYGDGYVLLPDVLALNGEGDSSYSRNGYIKREKFFREYPILQMPDDVTAGSETYEAAYAWQNKNGQRPFFGGALNDGSVVSPRSRHCAISFSLSYANYGSRPLKR